jgi:hypothetical protein
MQRRYGMGALQLPPLRLASLVGPMTVKTHGASGYRRGCRCEVCREGKRLKQREAYTRARGFDDIEAINVTQGGGYRIEATCPNCGGDLLHVTSGRATDAGRVIQAVTRCAKRGCNRSWLLRVSALPLDAVDPSRDYVA